MGPLEAAVDRYVAASSAEGAGIDRLKAAIAAGNPWGRDRPLHVTASAFVVVPTESLVLLRWHRRANGWLHVGGHGDPGECDPWVVAVREAREETGLTDLAPLTPEPGRHPVQVVVVPVSAARDEPAHEHADIRYVLATRRPHLATAESADAPLRWTPVGDAVAEVEEENLREGLVRVARLLGRGIGCEGERP